MARNNDLASLAALGALGYMLTRNGNKVDLNQPTSSGDSNPTRGAGYNSTETRNAPSLNLKTPSESIADADVSSKADSIVSRGPSGTTTPGPAAQSSTGTTTQGPDYLGGITPAVKSKAVKSKDVKGSNLAPAQKKTTDMYPSGVMGGAKSSTPSAAKKPQLATSSSGEAINAIANPQTQEDRMRRYQRDAQSAEKINQMNRKTNLFNANPAMEDQIRQNMNSAGMKKGGAVKKMASGGMTSSASRRADGIASKGKTRGKIC
jgi:hypothetical protein